jgi:GNAT superfamily N-acetyltransferase
VLLDEEPAWGACLDNLHVRPGFIGQGLGHQLFIAAVRWVKDVEPGWPMHLWVFEANTRARRFYDRHGGEVTERAVKPMPGGVERAVLRYVWC